MSTEKEKSYLKLIHTQKNASQNSMEKIKNDLKTIIEKIENKDTSKKSHPQIRREKCRKSY